MTPAQIIKNLIANTTTVIPATLTGDVNNYDPGSGGLWMLSSDASRNITGLGMPGSDIPASALALNAGLFDIIFQHQNLGSSTSNRILSATGADYTLEPDQACAVVYDPTITRWRLFPWLSSSSGGSGLTSPQVLARSLGA